MSSLDAVIIGSGASGSVIAWRLAREGLRVAVLEKGTRYDPTTFEHSEFTMMPRVYKYGGLQSTTDNSIVILQGATVGGSTVVNNAIWKRADWATLSPQWEAMGAHIDVAAVTAAYAELEGWLDVAPIPLNMANAATAPFLAACEREAVPAELLSNNRAACIGCGWCNYGCRYNRKTSALATLIPWAESKEALILDECHDVRLHQREGVVRSVSFVRRGTMQSLTADRYIVCAGAIGSSEVLLASHVGPEDHVGRGFHVLGGATVNARMPELVNGYDRIGLTAIAAGEQNTVIETFFSPPGAFAVTMGGWFEEHVRRMRDYAHYMQAGVMVGSGPHGRISLDRAGRTRIDLRLSSDEIGALRRTMSKLTRIFLAAGATEVFPSTYVDISVRSTSDLSLLDQHIKNASDLFLGSAHPQGGNPMHEDHHRGVVDTQFRVHGTENLFVADASVFPTNILVNCQATVMAMAHTACRFIADAPDATKYSPAGTGAYVTRKPWHNHDGNQAAVPLRQYTPRTVDEVCAIVKDAERLGITVRPIGSSHSWSDVCVTPDFMVLTSSLNRVLELDSTLIKPAARNPLLIEVEAGITLRELNEILDRRGLGLPNMGGYDGQTVAGIMATSTHGSGIGFGPLAEMVESVDIVTSGGTIIRVEPTDGITDPSAFRGKRPNVVLVQDDQWYRTVLVSMGCTGIIYSVVMRVVPKFWLKEVRTLTTWERIVADLRTGDVIASNEHFELLLNPYAINGQHSCLVTTRNSISIAEPIPSQERRRHYFTELIAAFPGTGFVLRELFNREPKETPHLIETSIRGLVDDGYINKSFKVFNIGNANDIGAYSCEIALPMADGIYIAAVDRLLAVASDSARIGNIYQSGPIALRFVRASNIFLSPQQGSDTCMAELISVKGTLGSLDLMYRYERETQAFGGRPHWGQVNSLSAHDVHRLYPFLQDWLTIHRIVNDRGTFDSPFSRRVGLAQPDL